MPDSTIRRAALALGYECDNACVFCAQAGIDPSKPGDPRAALVELREDHDEVSFVGGEPVLAPRLLELVGLARELGFAAIGLQTNGRRLAADESLFDQLVAAGLTDLHLSIHGASAAAHDYHTDRPGSFAAGLDLLSRAQRSGLAIVATTVVTRSNFRELPKLPPVLKRHGVAGWLIELLRPFGRAADRFARVVPRFGMALPWALHGLEQARRHDLSAWIRGAPLCALGPFAASALPVIDPPSGARAPCDCCPALARCGSVDSVYLDVFGSKELVARVARPQAEFDEGRRRLMRMFVGVGPLLAREPQLKSPPAADEPEGSGKNRRLPVLANDPDVQPQSDGDS
ncbi:MAG: radical SAM protein [Enhygromyxa sp.]